MNKEQIEIIKNIFIKAKEHNLPLWIDGGWAIDAYLGNITREHEDIDIVFPEDRRSDYLAIIKEIGFSEIEEMDYGFTSKKENILLDSEVCKKSDNHYVIEGFPENSCSNTKTERIGGIEVCCTSWDKMYFEFLYLNKEVKKEDWKPKHYASLKIIEEHLPIEKRKEVEKLFNQSSD